jgi:Domain of unknown function (DUF4349)
MSTQHRSIKRYLTLGLGTALATLLVGCSSGAMHSGTSDSAVARAGSTVQKAAAAPQQGSADLRSSESSASGVAAITAANRPTIETRAVISTGSVTLVSKNLTHVRDEIDLLLGKYGGYVSREQTSNDKLGRPRTSTLEIRVPESDFDATMGSFAGFATVKSQHRTSEDVTTEVIDVNSRVATERDSIRKLRTFLRQTTTVGEIIRLESAISSREASLHSLRGQKRYLDDQTSMATIDAHLTRAPHAKAAKKHHDAGFLVGLKRGWTALGGSVALALTVVGALLPFAVLVALIGIPVLLLVRRPGRRTTQDPEPAPTE